jgi:glycosyltransferase involved in cell wall biosynthesis
MQPDKIMEANPMEVDDELSIIYFGNDWFAENRTSSHHIARHLAESIPLLYIEVPGMRLPQATTRDVTKLWRKIRAAFRSPRKIGPQMWHMTLPQVPLGRNGIGGKLNRTIGTWLVRRAMKQTGIANPISWFHVPHAGQLAGNLGERLVVYYCIDDYAALPGVNKTEIAAMDAALTRRADVVFAASSALCDAKKTANDNVVYSPHGVDAELFRQAADTSRPCAAGAADLKRPIIGFFGVLDDRMDIGLLRYLAQSRPNWTFLLIGFIRTDVRQLASVSNIVMPGAVPYASLPDWARAFDACVMPYRRDVFSASANPLKLREYLAAGKPIVSVPMPEAERFAGMIEVAGTPEEFLAKLDLVLSTDSENKCQERMNFVRPMTWDTRVSDVLATVKSFLGSRTRLRPR